MIEKAKEHPLAIRRKELNLSRDQLCEKINGLVSRETIGRIERGERTPRADTIEILADALECEPDYLLGRISHPRRDVSDIADQIPLSGAAIEGLMKLKQDRDSNKLKELKSPNYLCTLAEAIDYMICGILDSAGYYVDPGHYEGFDNNQSYSLIFDLIKAAKSLKVMDEMPAEKANANPFFADDYNNMEMSYKGILFNLGQELSSIISNYVYKHIHDTEEV